MYETYTGKLINESWFPHVVLFLRDTFQKQCNSYSYFNYY
ncbi:hypothetical protein EBCG_03331 [Escherichia marmotae]|nr:hypothetical protein EBCG_03331 [Escherichia marmotae]